MSEEREFEGKDLEEALGAAATALGVSQDELHYEMVEQGRRGLLGLGVKAVRIRVRPSIDAELGVEETGIDMEPSAEPVVRRERPAKPERQAKPEKQASSPVPPERAGDVEKTVRQMVELMGLDLDVSVEPQDGGVSLDMQGPDQKMLMAKNAELLSSIQFLLNRMARRAWPGVGRIHVACNGHARPRDDELVALARRVAKQVARTGKTRRLQPLNAYERRLVHLAVREFTGLTSSSDGEGALKRVRISKVQNQI